MHEWHPRDSNVFVHRLEETEGSFYNNLFDFGPEPKKKSIGELAAEAGESYTTRSPPATAATAASGATRAGESLENTAEEVDEEDLERCPVERAFAADSRFIFFFKFYCF